MSNYDSINDIMQGVEERLNTHPGINVRMRWTPVLNKNLYNDADYWLGVIYSAYERGIFTKDEMKPILLALRAVGAKSDYFTQIAKEVLF